MRAALAWSWERHMLYWSALSIPKPWLLTPHLLIAVSSSWSGGIGQ